MKKGWEIKRLGEVLLKTENVNPVNKPDDEVDYVDVSCVNNATLTIESTQRIKGKDAPSRARKRIRVNDVIFATIRPTLKRIAIVPERLDGQVCSTGFMVLRSVPSVTPRFLFYFLQTGPVMEEMATKQKGASYPAVTENEVKSLPIPIPPLAEQRRIVALLDEAFAGIAQAKANTEKNLQNARALFESELNGVFSKRGEGWVEKRLGEMCAEIFAGGDVPKDNYAKDPTPRYAIPIYTNGEKNNGLYGFTDQARVTAPSITISARGTIGFTAIRHECYYPAIRLIVLIPQDDMVELGFLFYGVKSRGIGHSGTSIPQLTVPMVRNLSINVPPLADQRRIASHLDTLSAETRRLAAVYERKLAELEALRKSLLHQAFAGGL